MTVRFFDTPVEPLNINIKVSENVFLAISLWRSDGNKRGIILSRIKCRVDTISTEKSSNSPTRRHARNSKRGSTKEKAQTFVFHTSQKLATVYTA